MGAVLNDIAEAIDLDRGANKKGRDGWWHPYVSRRLAMMPDWFIRHHPESAHAYIGDITRAAHDRWQIPAHETLRTLHQAVAPDGKLSEEARKAFFALLTPPAKTG
ncbi:hypothetical protein [Streptomyces sp. NPDC046832]|uniref:hypothetical protein n=1 Tax=Streptomyces sp. NPDC046832 TaxID=3155020 RepID=UPI0033D774B9